MLSKLEIVKLESVIEQEYSRIADNLVMLVVKSLQASPKTATATTNAWRLAKLKQMGRLSSAVEAQIVAESKRSRAVIEKAVDNAIEKANDNDMAIFRKAVASGAIPEARLALVGTDSQVFQRYKESILANCRKAMNLTNTKALEISKEAYRNAINSAYIDAKTGVKSIGDAVNDACHELGGTGLHVTYISDRGNVTTYPLDASIRRDIVTSFNQSTMKMMLAENEMLGNDLVQVSVLGDSRPEHVEFQGKVYSQSGKSKKYPPLSETGVGTVTGIGGINCRHQLFPYYEDLEGSHKNEDASKAEEDRINRSYQITQEQRMHERQLRQAKRMVEVDKAGTDKDRLAKSQALLDKREQEMKDFIRTTGRGRSIDRERI